MKKLSIMLQEITTELSETQLCGYLLETIKFPYLMDAVLLAIL